MNNSLKTAQESLQIIGVYLKESKIFVRDKIDLPSIEFSETITQVYRGVAKILETPVSDDPQKQVWDYRFQYTVGIRLIFSEEEEESQEETYDPLVEIAAMFTTHYISKTKLDEHEISAFSDDNVGYHVWPYWREYVQSTCGRMNLSPALEVPLYHIPKTE